MPQMSPIIQKVPRLDQVDLSSLTERGMKNKCQGGKEESLEKYGKYFETVEFSIYCPKKETRNYKIFKEILEKTEEKRD